MSELIYIASPYSHNNEDTEYSRFEQVCEYAGAMMRAGKNIYSPIAHSHPIAERVGLPTGWEYWHQLDHAMITRCTELHVLQIDGWQESVGVAAEIKIAQAFGIPVTYSGEEVET